MIGAVLLDAQRRAGPRVLITLLLWLILALWLAPFLSAVAIGAGDRAVRDLTAASLWLVGCGWAMSAGVDALGHHDRTALTALVRPLSRRAWVGARLLGLWASALCFVALGAAGWALVVAVFARGPDASLLGWTLLFAGELLVVSTLAALLSTAARPRAAFGFTAGLWAVGHLAGPFAAVAEGAPTLAALHAVLWTLLPDLSTFDAQAALVHRQPLAALDLLRASGYAAGWTALLALGVDWRFRRLELV